jgi:hypothetical protein
MKFFLLALIVCLFAALSAVAAPIPEPNPQGVAPQNKTWRRDTPRSKEWRRQALKHKDWRRDEIDPADGDDDTTSAPPQANATPAGPAGGGAQPNMINPHAW